MNKLVITGKGDALNRACDAWANTSLTRDIIRVEIDYGAGFSWDASLLTPYPSESHDLFLAMDNHALNMARLKIMMDLKQMNYRLETYISPSASVAVSATIGEACFVSDGAVIGSNVTVRANSYIGPRTVLGLGTKIGHSCWLDAAVVTSEHVQIGANTTLGPCIQIHAGCKIGKQCEISRALEITEDIPNFTFYSPMFEGRVRIYGPQ